MPEENEEAKEQQVSSVEFSLDDEEELQLSLRPDQLSQAVMYHTDWTVGTILNQLERKNILLTPDFQRRDAWPLSKKIRFIESLFLNLPVPQVVLAEQRDQRGKYIVLDGKQRLLSLLQFVGRAPGSSNNNFKLRGSDIELDPDLRGQTYRDMSEDVIHQDKLDQFLNYTIRSVIVRGWPSEDFLYIVFIRLNTGSVQLSPQELRQALVPGPLAQFLNDFSSKSKALQQLLGNNGPDFRMRDMELLLRFLAFQFFAERYAGDLKHFLDRTTRDLTDEWDRVQDKVRERSEAFETGIEAAAEIFGWKNVARKWTGIEYQRRLNRALLDVIAYYFADPKVRSDALQHKPEIEEALKAACAENLDFRTAIDQTTKSLGATWVRFAVWGEALSGILGRPITPPAIGGMRI